MLHHPSTDSPRRLDTARRAGESSLDLPQLRTFLAVYRAGSFTAASKLLGLSQSTVTTRIRALEERLGTPLFERLPRGVASTASAVELAAEVAAPLDELASVAERDRNEPATPSEPVRLAGPATLLSVRVLPSLAPSIGSGIRLGVTFGQPGELLNGLRGGRFDLVLSTARPRGRAVNAVPLLDEELVLVCAPGTATRIDRVRLRDRDPAALGGIPLVAYADDLPLAREYWRHVFGTRPTEQATIVVPDLRAIRSTVTAGQGIAVLPRYLCESELVSGELTDPLEPANPPENTVFLAQRADATENHHVTLLRQELLRIAGSW
ncbi:DNA-binding transcriptional regulator, LysR family [Actinopolyspora xinjiangensis]|uniref:DNA-binding transcriptional regulator, LysR family n=1 Tax=Actinopolyspora xinjiangensis TaxID=405564 RepID=A0A1H0WRS6_9ACTN|nr:LysR family transcriptional regulator [Actinopolyspora xinjiangensis]SDP93349.1 DNA-binding transcriptional regulator, LysR family [Actinopolyspora xinjiangensis]